MARTSLVGIDVSGQKITTLGTPTVGTDAATKDYVDSAVSGARDVKESVRLATAVALPAYTRTGNVITASANGALTVDGVAVANNDRVLVKDGAAGADNGIYTQTTLGTGAVPYVLTRATDADASAEVTGGLYVWVTEGTANADTGWLLTTDDPITLNTTALTFTQVSALGQVTAGAGLTKSGASLAVGAGTGITVNADDVALTIPVAVASGGTGGTTGAAAKSNLGFLTRFAASYGDGAATSFNIDHNLGTLDVTVQVYRVSDGVEVEVDVTRSTTNRVILVHAAAPTTNQYRTVIVG